MSWSHYIELLKLDDPLERSFYEKECEEEHWGVRELKRQIKSMLFHRLALSTDKQEVLKLASEGQIIEKPEDITGTAYADKSTMVKLLAEKYDGVLCEENYYDRLQSKQENYDHCLRSGFHVILRNESRTVTQSLELVKKSFGLA